jgi:dolichol-phosphate mannosyltransferase
MPTYNEAGNVLRMISDIRNLIPNLHILVVDDGSPDGTADLVRAQSRQDNSVFLLERDAKAGLGAAYRAGFRWALEREYTHVVEMDADGSHQPKFLPELLAAAQNSDLVIGSRWVRGGSVVNWPLSRKILSQGGNLYTRILLGMPIHDATGGFRVLDLAVAHEVGLLQAQTQGYVFQVDNSYRFFSSKRLIKEVPITFIEREIGESKMSRRIVIEAMLHVTLLAWRHRVLRRPLI